MEKNSSSVFAHTPNYRDKDRADDHFNESIESSHKSNAYTYISLHIVPVIVKCVTKRIRVNALLDDASEQSYIHSDIV